MVETGILPIAKGATTFTAESTILIASLNKKEDFITYLEPTQYELKGKVHQILTANPTHMLTLIDKPRTLTPNHHLHSSRKK